VLGRSAFSAALISALLVISGCSADSVAPPEPTVETPGAFVFAVDDGGVPFLFRTLFIVPIDSTESLLDAILYVGEPSGPEQARAWAKDRALSIDNPHAMFSLRGVLSLEPEVVWFRTLAQSELARSP
jgi:hypothetical protein